MKAAIFTVKASWSGHHLNLAETLKIAIILTPFTENYKLLIILVFPQTTTRPLCDDIFDNLRLLYYNVLEVDFVMCTSYFALSDGLTSC